MKPNKFKRFAVKRKCRSCEEGCEVDYKDLNQLSKCITPQGKIISSKRTNYCKYCQKKLAQAVKHARYVALLPYIA